jgi:uncharacterized protein YcfJ
MNRRISTAIVILALGAVASGAQAGGRDSRGRDHDHDHDRGYAQVLHVEPVFERVRYVVPVEHCWNEQVAYRAGPNGGAIVGGVLGAAVGSNIGRDQDRAATTIAGAAIGAAIGNQVARERDERVRYETVRRCETRHEERWDRQVVAYRVTYVYRGRADVVRLAYDPGRRLRLDDARRRG